MKPKRSLRPLAAALIVVAGLVALPGAASAASTPRRIYACVTRTYNTLNLTTQNGHCADGQFKVSWSVSGTAGPRGATGPRGQRGPRGDRGDTGPRGANGANGPAGANGATGPAGPTGAIGPIGPIGPTGPTGPAGTSGSPDTPAQVLAKLLQVDGSGSGLDADLLDGQDSSSFQQRVTGTCSTGGFVQSVGADGTVGCAQAITVPLNLTQPSTTDDALDVSIPNAGSSGRAISVDNEGVGTSVFSNTVGGNSIWGVVGSISAAAVIGDSSSGEAVVGRQNGAICNRNIGRCNGIGAVVGRADGDGGYGVRGFQTSPNGGYGVIGQTGISGGTGVGVRGENVNAANNDNAVEAVTNGNGSALFAQGRTTAATFNGAVQINGDLTVTGTKSGFRIDDPRARTQRTLTSTPVETNTLIVTYSGNVTTDAHGSATVHLPSYGAAIAGDWRYQLTPIGQFGQAIVGHEADAGGAFTIRTSHPRMKVSWSVVGIRHDPEARQDAIVPIAPKTGRARGRYLDPALYGRPSSLAVTPPLKTTAPAGKGAKAAAAQPRLASSR